MSDMNFIVNTTNTAKGFTAWLYSDEKYYILDFFEDKRGENNFVANYIKIANTYRVDIEVSTGCLNIDNNLRQVFIFKKRNFLNKKAFKITKEKVEEYKKFMEMIKDGKKWPEICKELNYKSRGIFYYKFKYFRKHEKDFEPYVYNEKD